MGNALRRAILGYSAGGAITGLKIKGVMHEYNAIDGVTESVFAIMANFKKLRFKTQESTDKLQWITLRCKGVGVVLSNDLKLPAGITLLTEDVALLEITDPSVELIIEYRLEK